MLLRSSVSNEDSGPFRIIGQFFVFQNQPYPCEFNSFSDFVRKQWARARHVFYDDLMINWSLWILVSLNGVFPLRPFSVKYLFGENGRWVLANDHDKGLWLTVVLGITRVARTVMSYNEWWNTCRITILFSFFPLWNMPY